MAGLLCEEEGPGADNVKYCGYCKHHYNKMVRRSVNTRNDSTVKIVADENVRLTRQGVVTENEKRL